MNAGRVRRGGALLAAVWLCGAVHAAPAAQAMGNTPVGLWQTISDVDGKPKAYIRIREINGELRGVVEQVLEPDKRGELCEKCPGERHNQPLLGLTVITGMHRDGDRYTGGDILDPDNGNLYSCRLQLVDDGRRLDVRGYLGFSLFGRTQTWVRLE